MAGIQWDDDQNQSSSVAWDDAPKQPTQKQVNTELSVGEKLVSMLPKGAQEWLSNPSLAGVGLGKGSAVHGAMLGAADPVVGAAQLATLGQNATINKAIDDKNAEYEAARQSQGREGFDAARTLGNVASPASVALSYVTPVNAATTAGKVLQGARAGVAGGAIAPVENADTGYVGTKLAQTAGGGIVGGAMAPVASAIGEKFVRAANARDPVVVSKQADDAMREMIGKMRQDGIEVTQDQIKALRSQVVESLNQGKTFDASAAARKADFEALGIQPTRGQVSRDPVLFSREKNLQGVAGIGDPLNARFNAQDARLQELITGKSAGAADDFTAGQKIISALQGVDDGMRSKVDAAYGQARDHLGRAAPMDHVEFSKNSNLVLDSEMLGGVLPSQVRNILNDVTLGKIPLNVNTAVQIDQTLSRIQRGATDAEKYAIGKVRDVLNKTQIADNVGEDAKLMFDTARGVAKQRFDTHKAIPALQAAIDGDVSAQDFTRRFLVNGKAEEVSSLAKVLPDDALGEARKQFGVALERAAFGENMTGDAAFSAARFSKFLNQPGMRQKLEAFYSPQEVAQLDRIARVGAYKNTLPANHAVNTSNTSQGLANLGMIARIPGIPQSVGLLTAVKNMAGNQMAVNSALRADIPTQAANISPKQLEFLGRILGGGAGGFAVASGTGIGN